MERSKIPASVWFAVVINEYDDVYDLGSTNLEEAKDFARKVSDHAFIAIIYNGVKQVRVGTIKRSDF